VSTHDLTESVLVLVTLTFLIQLLLIFIGVTIIATQADALAAIAALSTEVSTLQTDVAAYITANPVADYTPIISALVPISANIQAVITSVTPAPPAS
jgi:hypothetical protein